MSVHLSGPVTRPRGGSRLAALTAYAARMSGRLSSAANGVHDLLDKRVFVLETERIELVDTRLQRGTMRVERVPSAAALREQVA